jgi:hypothetical protein
MGTKDYLINRIKELELELIGARAALLAFDNFNYKENLTAVEAINTADKVTDTNENSFLQNGTWLENILYVIKDKNRFVHNSEIAEVLLPYYPDKNKDDVKRRISAVISNAFAKNKIEGLTNYKFSNSIKDTVWGKKEWLDDNGKIKPEYNFIDKKSNKPKQKYLF